MEERERVRERERETVTVGSLDTAELASSVSLLI